MISVYHCHVIISVPPRRIADLLYHAAVSADNDIHGEYGAVVAVPEPAIAVVDAPVVATQYHAQDELGQYRDDGPNVVC